MQIQTAIMTLFNVTAMADDQITDEEKKMIFDVLKKQFFCTDEELEQGFEDNLEKLKEDSVGMIKKAVLVMREKCSVDEMRNVIKLLKDLTTIDRYLDRREQLIIEMLEQLIAVEG